MRRGRRGDLIKLLWWGGSGLCLFAKRLERGRFVWPSPADGPVVITPAQLATLLEGIELAHAEADLATRHGRLSCGTVTQRDDRARSR